MVIDDQARVEAAVVATFLARHRDDTAAGRRLPLEHYLAQFPDWSDAIRREYAAATGAEDVEQEPRWSVGARAQPGERLLDRGLLAKGGMGEIRRVWDRELQRTLALKRLGVATADGAKGSGSRSLARFVDEARITARLEHPGIVPVHEFGVDDRGQVYFTMPLLRGRTLHEILELAAHGREGWSRTRVVGVLMRVCETVGFAHSRGVVHRDLKPANVMVGEHGEVYVMDWGLARVLDREAGGPPAAADAEAVGVAAPAAEERALLTMAGDVIGTPAYMSPEQARGEVDRIGPQTDVHAIGAMLYHALAGHAPHLPPGSDGTPRAVLDRVVDGPPAPLESLSPRVAPELVAICNRAMAPAPEQRYPDVGALAEDLRAYLEGRVVAAYEAGTLAALRKWVRRNRALSAASALAVVALVVGLVVSVLFARRASEQARRAAVNAGWAFDAVDSLLTRLAEDQLVDAPESQGLRRDLLREAVRFQKEFAASRRDDPAAIDELISAHGRLATAQVQLGDFEDVAATVAEAERLIALQLTAHPERTDLLIERAWARSMMACDLVRRRQLPEAGELLEQALRDLRPLSAGPSTPPRVLARLGSVLNNLAVVRRHSGDPAAAADLLREAVTVATRRVAADPTRPAQDSLLSQLANLAGILSGTEHRDEAVAVVERGLELVGRLLAEEPTRRQLQAERARLLNVRGELHRRAGERREAAAAYADSAQAWQELIEAHPDVPDYRYNLAGGELNQGLVKSAAAARSHYAAAAAHMEILLRGDPGNADYQDRMRRALHRNGLLAVRLRDHAEAARCAERLLGLDVLGARATRSAAELYCHCTELTVSDGDRAVHAEYRRKAGELVAALLASGDLSREDAGRAPWVSVR